MGREKIFLECTEARLINKPVSRYITSKNKKKGKNLPIQKKKYNRFLQRHTLHKEIKI